MSSHLMEDPMSAVPVNIHNNTCSFYLNRDLGATTKWYEREIFWMPRVWLGNCANRKVQNSAHFALTVDF